MRGPHAVDLVKHLQEVTSRDALGEITHYCRRTYIIPLRRPTKLHES